MLKYVRPASLRETPMSTCGVLNEKRRAVYIRDGKDKKDRKGNRTSHGWKKLVVYSAVMG